MATNPYVLDFSGPQNMLARYHQAQMQQRSMDQQQGQFDQTNMLARDRFGLEQQAAQRQAEEAQRMNAQRQSVTEYLGRPNVAPGVPQPLVDLSRITANPEPIKDYIISEAKRKAALGGPEEYGKSGAVFQNPDGTYSAIQFGGRGNLKTHNLSSGVSPARGIKTVDDGLGTQIVDAATGNTVRRVERDVAGAKTQAEVGEARGKFIAAIPKLEMANASMVAKNELVSQDIAKAKALADSYLATGLSGAALKNWPQTDAFALRETIKTIKGNIGFDALQQMRVESPTGGALGQVAVQELEYLQSVLGSLEQAQRADDIKNNLDRIDQFIKGRAQRVQEAFQKDARRFGADVATPPQMPQPGPPKIQDRLAPPSQPLPRIRTPQEAARLPRGSQFLDPNGNIRTVP